MSRRNRSNSSGDPIGQFFIGAFNTVSNRALQRLDAEIKQLLGLKTGLSPQEQIRLDRMRLALERERSRILEAKDLRDRQLRLLDLRIIERTMRIERAKAAIDAANKAAEQLQLPFVESAVTGALDITADPGGLNVSLELVEAYHKWLEGFEEGKVILIVGRRGSGKSALAGKMAEYMMATYRMPAYWVGLPSEAKKDLPKWISIVDDAHKCPVGSFIIVDEAGINFLSLLFNTSRNRFLRALLMVCRQRHCSLVFAVQSTTDIDVSILRQCDTLIFKQPSRHQPETERPTVRPRAKRAADIFAKMSHLEALESALVFDDSFEGLIQFTPPSFWTESLSHAYANFDLNSIENNIKARNQIRDTIDLQTDQLAEASMEKLICEDRRQGMGFEAIAKKRGVTVWKIRQVLKGVEEGGS